MARVCSTRLYSSSGMNSERWRIPDHPQLFSRGDPLSQISVPVLRLFLVPLLAIKILGPTVLLSLIPLLALIRSCPLFLFARSSSLFFPRLALLRLDVAEGEEGLGDVGAVCAARRRRRAAGSLDGRVGTRRGSSPGGGVRVRVVMGVAVAVVVTVGVGVGVGVSTTGWCRRAIPPWWGGRRTTPRRRAITPWRRRDVDVVPRRGAGRDVYVVPRRG